MEVVTLWLAADDSTPENGCMRVIPGSHHTDLRELEQRKDIPNVLESGLDESTIDDSTAVDIVLRAGDVSLHHPNIIHGSNPNVSTRRRSGLTIRYIPTTTRILTDETFPSAFLLRGDPVDGVNSYNPRPTYVDGDHMPSQGCQEWSRDVGEART